MVIEHADFEGVERLSLVTGGDVVSTFGEGGEGMKDRVKLGKCDLIEEIVIGEDKVCSLSLAHIL
jgi:T-complex protein 1 subunit beta